MQIVRRCEMCWVVPGVPSRLSLPTSHLRGATCPAWPGSVWPRRCVFFFAPQKALSSRSSSLIHLLTTSIHQRQLNYENAAGENRLRPPRPSASSSRRQTRKVAFSSLSLLVTCLPPFLPPVFSVCVAPSSPSSPRLFSPGCLCLTLAA